MRTSRTGRVFALTFVLTVAFVVVALAVPAAALARDLYVDVTRGDDFSGDGTYGRPYRSITKGMAVAGYGDSVHVAAGNYSALTGEVFPIVVTDGEKLLGDRTPLTMVEGLRGTVIEANNTNTCIRILGASSNTVVDGIYFDANDSPANGGAIRIEGGTNPGGGPTLRNCMFYVQSAPSGGAIYIDKGAYAVCTPVVQRCWFISCVADTVNGGGISAVNAVPQIRECWFLACGSSAGDGGAISLMGGSAGASIDDCIIVACGAPTAYGGGVYAENQPIVVRTTTVLGCFAANGAGLAAADTILPLDTTFDVENCILTQNVASNSAGGILGAFTATTVRDCTIESNSALGAGGIYQVGASSSLTVANTILWGNGDDIATLALPTVTLSYSCIEDGDAGTGVIHADPLLADLQDTPRLLPGSPCIDAGSNTFASATDFEGRPRPADGDGNGTAIADMGAFERDPYADRASGADRYETAVAASEAHFDFADHVVLATGVSYPDALCSASLAALLRGPVLLTRPNELPASVATELERLGVEKIYVVGGESAVSDVVLDDLRAAGYAVERLSGADRYATSQMVAQELADLLGANLGEDVIVARGDAFPDALSASALAGWEGIPILLTRPDQLPTNTMSAISDLGFTDVIVVGGTAAVSDYAFSQLEALVSGTVVRVFGADRYATSVKFAEFVDTDPRFYGGWDHDYFGMATGTNFPDALCGGPVCGRERGPMLLTRPEALPSDAAAYLEDWGDLAAHVEVFGGSAAVRDAVLAQVEALLP